MDILGLMLWPALACVILTAIHTYLGLHVVERGVIFVDLSLAQVAALGTAAALLAGYDVHGSEAYLFSMGFALSGAGFFAVSRIRDTEVPQEAVIGIVYAVSAAAAILLMDRAPEGAEHIKHLMVGNILAVGPFDVLKLAILYAAVGFLHWLWRRPFLLISKDPRRAEAEGWSVRAWDFAFYALFSVVVTFSVPIAGVFLVFAYFVIPSVAAMLFVEGTARRLAFGWMVGVASSFAGLAGSYFLDAPTGASIVCAFGLILALLGAARACGAGRSAPPAAAGAVGK